MALCEIRWYSDVLQRMVGTLVIVPERGQPPFATFYLLHGLNDDYTSWQRRTRIEWYVRDLPLILVMPDGQRSFYTDHRHGPAYARFFAEELVWMIERTFPARPARSARCIGGLSMGGYGALRLALGYPGVFASANSHSGALLHGSRPPTGPIAPELKRIFGSRPAGSDHDLLALVERCRRAGKLPKLRIDCGHEDQLLEDNRSFHRRLREMDVYHEYEEFPGGHNWDYWDYHVNLALMFHSRNLRLRPLS